MKHLESKASSPNKGLIGKYHYGFNIEHAKPVLEKGLIVNSLLGDVTTATKQHREWKGFLQASLYMHQSQI